MQGLQVIGRLLGAAGGAYGGYTLGSAGMVPGVNQQQEFAATVNLLLHQRYIRYLQLFQDKQEFRIAMLTNGLSMSEQYGAMVKPKLQLAKEKVKEEAGKEL